MRFEGKNAFIKGLLGKNYKNVPYTVAHRHQNYMCLQLLSPNFLYRGDEIGTGNNNNYSYTFYHS